MSLDLAGLTVQAPAGVPLEVCAGALCGLDDERGETLALGVVREVLGGALHVLAPLSGTAAVTGVRIGRERSDCQ